MRWLEYMKRVVVVGSLNMDVSIEADRIPISGETVDGKDLFLGPGGKGANQAVASARLGAETVMIGSVGADLFGSRLLESLANAGVDTSYISGDENDATGTAVVIRCAGDNRIIVNHGANYSLRAQRVKDALSGLARPGDILLAQLECPPQIVWEAIHEASALGMRVILNPSPMRTIPEDVLPLIDLLCLNESECSAMSGCQQSGEDDYRCSLEALRGRGVRRVVLTLGSRGSVLLDEKGYCRIPAVKVNAVDTTGAGDTFVGALSACLAAGRELREAMKFAAKAAALATTQVGAQGSIPTVAEVENAFGRDEDNG
jgi:ribokinase